MVRAKFVVEKIITHRSHNGVEVFLSAVMDNTTEENRRFAKYTPSGELRMVIDNPPAAAFFELGKTCYVDFINAEESK